MTDPLKLAEEIERQSSEQTTGTRTLVVYADAAPLLAAALRLAHAEDHRSMASVAAAQAGILCDSIGTEENWLFLSVLSGDAATWNKEVNAALAAYRSARGVR